MHVIRIAPFAILGLLLLGSCAASTPPICYPQPAWDSGRDQAAAGQAYRYELGSVCSAETETQFRAGYTAGIQLYCVPDTAYQHGKNTALAGGQASFDVRLYAICTQQAGFQQAYTQGHASGVAELCVPAAGAKQGYDAGAAGQASQFDSRAYSLCSPVQLASMSSEYQRAHSEGVASFCSQASAQVRAQGVQSGRQGYSGSLDESPYRLCPMLEIRNAYQEGKLAGLQEYCSPATAAQMGEQQGLAGAAASYDGARYQACSSTQQRDLRQAFIQGHSQGLTSFCQELESVAVASSYQLGEQGRDDAMLANFGNCPRATVATAQRAAQQAYARGLNQFCSAPDAESVWSQAAEAGDPLRPYRRCSPQQFASLQNRYNRFAQARLASFCSEDRLRSAAAELAQAGTNTRLPVVFEVCLQSYPGTARFFAQQVRLEREAIIASQCSYQVGEAQGRQDALENRRKQTGMPSFCDRRSFNVYLTGYLEGWKNTLCSEDIAFELGLRDARERRQSNYRAPQDCRAQSRLLSEKYAEGYSEGQRSQGNHGHGNHNGDGYRPGRPHNWSSDPDVIRACGGRFNGTANEQACLDLMTRVYYPPHAMIEACDLAMNGDTNELACLRLAVSSRLDPTSAIAACDSAMDGDTNELTCIQLSMASRFPLERAIAACDSAMDGDTNELSCIKLVAQTRYDTTASIAACDSAMDGDTNELQCIALIAKARQDLSRTIQACDEGMSGNTSKLECIRKAVR